MILDRIAQAQHVIYGSDEYKPFFNKKDYYFFIMKYIFNLIYWFDIKFKDIVHETW